MGIQLKWQALLTKENTYLIVLGGILLTSILWIVLVKRTSQKKVSESWNRNETSF